MALRKYNKQRDTHMRPFPIAEFIMNTESPRVPQVFRFKEVFDTIPRNATYSNLMLRMVIVPKANHKRLLDDLYLTEL